VRVFPADGVAPLAVAVDEGRVVVLVQAVADTLAGATLDAPELLDVDVDQLAGAGALIAQRRLEPQPPELAHPEPGQDPRHRRQRHPRQLGDLSASEAKPAQRGDRLDPPLIDAVGHHDGRRRAIHQPRAPFDAIARQLDALGQQPAALDAETSVAVQLHPVSSLGPVASTPPGLQGGPDEHVLRNYT
jgi:hypothetical protein